MGLIWEDRMACWRNCPSETTSLRKKRGKRVGEIQAVTSRRRRRRRSKKKTKQEEEVRRSKKKKQEEARRSKK